MRRTDPLVAPFLLLGMLLATPLAVLAATDGFYQLSEVASSWDGTELNRSIDPTADADFSYGDESNVTYTLPWPFVFYGQSYSQVNADTNGNVWFTSPGSSHSFDLANTGRGPVIAAWNDDLSSYYYGGAFIQHKKNPERVVIEWQTETYSEEGLNNPNDFEVVLFPNGSARVDYQSFATNYGKDFGSGISKGDGSAATSITGSTAGGPVYTLGGRSFNFTPLPTITDAPATIGFGNVYLGTSSPPQTVMIHNLLGTLVIGSVSVGGNDASQFLLNDGCTGRTLSGSQSCAIGVTLSPTTLGAKDATLIIAANDPAIPTTSTRLNGNIIYPVISVAKAGTGAGVVSSSPVGLGCGDVCAAQFATGTLITLTATPDAESSFAGWSGGECSGTAPCATTLNASASITATFNILPPVCDFYGSPTAGGFPHSVGFMDLSQRTNSVVWDFGDGNTSTLRNPDHTYVNLGAYTVTLAGSNTSGTCSVSKQGYVSIMPIRIQRQIPIYFNTISAAYAAAQDGETIQCQAIQFHEDLNLNETKSVTIEGGYDSAFVSKDGFTTLHGATNLTAGAITWRNFDLPN